MGVVGEEREALFERYLERLAGGVARPRSRFEFPDFAALRAFEATARERSFAAAARKLSCSEAEIRRHVAGLETRLSVALTRKHTIEIELTAEGKRLAQGIRAGLAEIADALEALETLRPLRLRSWG
ncbi:MAG TPA: LysR family transcriptional regulator [Stellaceae bacterium]|nr:LysR family transcriptional regulator [Stellaceae bacterium]